MTARAETPNSNLALVFQVAGALALLVVAIVAGVFFFKVAAVVVTQVLPIVVVAMVLYVLLKLMVDAGRETAEY